MILGACTGRQLDIIISCFTGYYDDGGLYIDDMHTVGANPLANHPLLFPVERFSLFYKRMDSSLEIPEDTVQILVRFGHLGAVLILRSHLV